MEAANQTVHSNSLDGARAWFAERGLARRREDRMLAGVAGAFARRYEVNPFAMRVFAVLRGAAHDPALVHRPLGSHAQGRLTARV